MTIPLNVAEQGFRRALHRAINAGLRIVSSEKFTWSGTRVTGCCVLGAAELDPRSCGTVLPGLPQGARGAIADGFDGQPFDRGTDDGLGAWYELGKRLRSAYRLVRA